MSAFGLPPEAFAAVQETLVEFEVESENWPTVVAFMAAQTQWRTGPDGRRIGLDYVAVDVLLRRRGIEDERGSIFAGMQVMEFAALEAMAES
jgi:hypothetical protein